MSRIIVDSPLGDKDAVNKKYFEENLPDGNGILDFTNMGSGKAVLRQLMSGDTLLIARTLKGISQSGGLPPIKIEYSSTDNEVEFEIEPEVLGVFYEPWGESTFNGEVNVNSFCATRFTASWTRKINSISIFTKNTSANVDPIVLAIYECITPNSVEKTFTKIYNSSNITLASANYGIITHDTSSLVNIVEGRLYQVAVQRASLVGGTPLLQANSAGLNRFGFNTNATNQGSTAPSSFTVNDNNGTQVGSNLSSASGHSQALWFRLGLTY